MQTFKIPIISSQINDESQRELEVSLSKIHSIKDFVFNEKGNLEVTFDNKRWDLEYVYSECVIYLQRAFWQSGYDRATNRYDKSETLFI